ncbi:MAG: FeoA family protein [Archaeoglobaceae archaeon]|nr:ferrous iron transport protein A [Archaeoglobaceae archaeon]MDW7989490.1 FeoA family protein [Archaeoglobaceae archaeon]
MIPLSLAHGKVKIKEIKGNGDFVKRLADMGLTTGQILEIVTNGPPVIVRIRDSEIALGHGIAKRVFVEVIDV